MGFHTYAWTCVRRAISGTFGIVSTLVTFVGVLAVATVSVVPAAPPRLTDLRLQVGLLLLVVVVWRLVAAPPAARSVPGGGQ